MKKYQNKYRITSARAQWWDYGWNGAYFITICTHDRNHYFGVIQDGKMILSSTGIIADVLWCTIPNHHKFVELGEFVVMPNHIHGILILDKPDDTNATVIDKNIDNDIDNDIEEGHALPLYMSVFPTNSKLIGQNRFQNIGKNTVSSIIGSYKSAVTKHANRLGLENGWQPLFHDHIIRDPAEYHRITNYIINNPANWSSDKYK